MITATVQSIDQNQIDDATGVEYRFTKHSHYKPIVFEVYHYSPAYDDPKQLIHEGELNYDMLKAFIEACEPIVKH
jgi:hypothetical protein